MGGGEEISSVGEGDAGVVVVSGEMSEGGDEVPGGRPVSKDSTKGVRMPRMGSPRASALSWRRTSCRLMFARRRARDCLSA